MSAIEVIEVIEVTEQTPGQGCRPVQEQETPCLNLQNPAGQMPSLAAEEFAAAPVAAMVLVAVAGFVWAVSAGLAGAAAAA